jgi:hypothetical protein
MGRRSARPTSEEAVQTFHGVLVPLAAENETHAGLCLKKGSGVLSTYKNTENLNVN